VTAALESRKSINNLVDELLKTAHSDPSSTPKLFGFFF
jgi:hypothetical protein